jgi:hypothetical protein
VSADTPVRLTFPSYDRGAVDIMADGKCVGFALAEFWNWRAYLFPVSVDSRAGRPADCEEVATQVLADLRRVLRERVAERGPWWESPETGAQAGGRAVEGRE